MSETSTKTSPKHAVKKQARSRMTNGRALLPGIDGRSIWARVYRDCQFAMVSHLGGESRVTEPQRSLVRRAVAMEVELLALESEFMRAREAGSDPEVPRLDLYARLANGQRRFLEAIGLQSVPHDVTPTLQSYLASKAAQ